jgi:alginate O-acetyltransferase complex protein AlgI
LIHMVFTSFNFLLFFPLLTLVYFIAPAKYRWLILLTGSYFFYINMNPVYALLLAGITLSTYLFARLIDKTDAESKKKAYMIVNVIIILLPLFFFKYFGAVNDGVFALLTKFNIKWPLPHIELLLPVGISFYTFMAIGYTIDVYNEEIEAEKNIGILALFISFFPLILSGPIERAKNMLPQFKTKKEFDYNRLGKGLKLMLWGYFMKLVVADRLGIYINPVYESINQHNGTSLLFASFLYPFQVYADLGGYSLIAIGTAHILGFNVIQNFRRPFFATSMAELWRRWHISLITWLTDYVYTPLAFLFRKYKIRGTVIALMITFLVSGIWHAPAVTYLVWGIMQGTYLSIEALTNKRRSDFEKKFNLSHKAWYIFSGCLLTFILFTASQVFARAPNMPDALLIYSKIFTTSGPLFIGAPSILIFGIFGIVMVLIKDFTDEFKPSKLLLFENKNIFVRAGAYSVIILLVFLIGVFDGGEFIYFKF